MSEHAVIEHTHDGTTHSHHFGCPIHYGRPSWKCPVCQSTKPAAHPDTECKCAHNQSGMERDRNGAASALALAIHAQHPDQQSYTDADCMANDALDALGMVFTLDANPEAAATLAAYLEGTSSQHSTPESK